MLKIENRINTRADSAETSRRDANSKSNSFRVLFNVTRETKLQYRVPYVPCRLHETTTPRAENVFPLQRICVNVMFSSYRLARNPQGEAHVGRHGELEEKSGKCM